MAAEFPQGQHRILSIEDRHDIGQDRYPTSQRTYQEIEAHVAMNCVRYVFNTDAVSVTVEEGGQASGLYVLGPGRFAVNLLLPKILEPGHDHTLYYHTDFHYPTLPPPLFKRFTTPQGMDHLQMSVNFDPLALPVRVSWTEWEGPEDDNPTIPGTQEELELQAYDTQDPDSPLYVYYELSDVPAGKFLGFQWEWPPEEPIGSQNKIAK